MMRRISSAASLAACLVLGLSVSAHGADVDFPAYDTAVVCHRQADYAFAATLGDLDRDREFKACTAREAVDRSSAQTLWSLVSAKDATECLELAEGRYGYLMRCLDGSRSIRAAR